MQPTVSRRHPGGGLSSGPSRLQAAAGRPVAPPCTPITASTFAGQVAAATRSSGASGASCPCSTATVSKSTWERPRHVLARSAGSAASATAPAAPEQVGAEATPSAQDSPGASGVKVDGEISPRREAQLTLEQYKEIYDRLIKIFQERPRDDWKKLIVFSKQWDQHRQGVFDRIKELSDKEDNLDRRMALRKLLRALQNAADEVARYNSILLKLGSAADDEWEAIVAVYRGDFQKPFFEHMQCLMAAAKDDKARLEQLVLINTRLVALVANHDAVAADPAKLEAAAELYRDLLSSITSVEDADRKMAELASAGRIDPAFLQISAKAYGAARDTNMTKDEAKWVAYKLYRNARDHFDRQQPAEKRIIEYLLSISDPTERRNLLDQAVTPGPTRMTETHDYMYSTPQRLFLVLDNTLRAYNLLREGATTKLNTPEAAVLPRKVRVMMELRDEIIRRYL